MKPHESTQPLLDLAARVQKPVTEKATNNNNFSERKVE